MCPVLDPLFFRGFDCSFGVGWTKIDIKKTIDVYCRFTTIPRS